jgi:pyruvate, orthophosphate dikinase
MGADRDRVADGRIAFLYDGSSGAISPSEVGSKAANLMRMVAAGLPVPPGFVLGTEICADYHSGDGRLGADVVALVEGGVRQLEGLTHLRFGGSRRPLLVAVRSGAAVSMPGMLDTILDVGLCDGTLSGLLRATGDPVFVWDSYRRLILSYALVVEGCRGGPFEAVLNDLLHRERAPVVGELDVAALRELVARYQQVYRAQVGRPFPQDPMDQLLGAVEAVLRSWNAPRAVEYRRLRDLSGLRGTAVTVQAMVFGNTGGTSGSGVGFTRDPTTGDNHLYVDFLLDSQGEDVVAGRHGAEEPERLVAAVPGLAHELQRVRRTLEVNFGDVQDFEFTVEDANLWILQTRAAKPAAWAALRIACDLVEEGIIDRATALERLSAFDLDEIRRVHLDPAVDVHPMARATPASSGVAVGRVALSVESALRLSTEGEPVVLVRQEASTDDIAALAACQGLVTATGARTSHAAVVARQLGVTCLVDCRDLAIDAASSTLDLAGRELREGDLVTVDGSDGCIYEGALDLVEERPTELVARVRGWQQEATTS